jgi:hypothetical protein
MEQTWQEKLNEILMKEPAALTPGDIEFLRARRSYLNADQLSQYAEVLSVESVNVEPEKVEKPAKKPSK